MQTRDSPHCRPEAGWARSQPQLFCLLLPHSRELPFVSSQRLTMRGWRLCKIRILFHNLSRARTTISLFGIYSDHTCHILSLPFIKVKKKKIHCLFLFLKAAFGTLREGPVLFNPLNFLLVMKWGCYNCLKHLYCLI